MNDWFVYIVEKKGKLYIGVTTDLENRIRQHGLSCALYVEGPLRKELAVTREKQLKRWTRKKKLSLISKASSQS